jgi:two-component system C4-dicarboxylate transport response regulator DctD
VAHILLVEDDAGTRYVTRAWLQASGHYVTEAPDGTAALAVFSRNPAALVVTDLCMPGGDGVRLIEKLRATSASLPIIAYSGHFADALDDAEHAGATVLLNKPFSRELFIDAVDTAIGGAPVPVTGAPVKAAAPEARG